MVNVFIVAPITFSTTTVTKCTVSTITNGTSDITDT